MIKGLLAAALTFSVAAAPFAASAQDERRAPPKRGDYDTPAPADQAAPAAATAAAAAPAKPLPLAVNMDQSQDLENILYLDLSNGKRVAIRLMPEWAPNHIERIKTLTRQGFYDGIVFHRVIDGFMAQTGDPTGTGRGGSELPDLKAEFNMFPHVRGTVAMARAQSEDSANSQFFIVFYPRFSLDRKYTNFGRVIAGMDAVDAIERGEPPASPTFIVQASIAADRKPQKFAPPPAPTVATAIVPPDLGAPAATPAN